MNNTSCGIRLVVEPTDRLHVPHRKRLSYGYVTHDSGDRELCIYYGSKEVVFDEQRLFAFGEELVRQSSFVAGAATAWGPGYEWPEVRALLEGLLAEGILSPGDMTDDPRGGGLVPSRVPPSTCPVARAWSSDSCEAITRDLGGRAIEIGHLEAILSVYRIAHPSLDADGRQVGEANVFPPGLRLDCETEWRVCHYAGSRYRDDAPMNVTALKAMIKHWKPMMMTLLEVRDELRRRLASSRPGWTVGELHLFSGVALSLPAFQLQAGGPAAPLPPLHPVLSSLFRIADGIRMTTHLMLFLSQERTRSSDEATTATELYDFAERNGVFLSRHGVCAGPRLLIEEFLTVVFDGTPVQGTMDLELPFEIRQLLLQLPAAVDYALLGLQAWAVSRSVWLAMSRAYRAIRDLLETSAPGTTGDAMPDATPDAPPDALGNALGDSELGRRLRERVLADWNKLDAARIAAETEREVHATVYADTYELSWRALRAPVGPPTLAECIAPRSEDATHLPAARRLGDMLTARCCASARGGAAAVVPLVATLVGYLRQEQAVLRSVAQLQAAINATLDRPRPHRALTVRDLRTTYVMNGGAIAEFPYLFDLLADELGIMVECTADAVAITDHGTGRAQLDRQLQFGVSAGVSADA
jgi:hypothetical protein